MLFIQLYFMCEVVCEGFVKEEVLGIFCLVLDCNYKDENYKFEVMVVLIDFWFLYGFWLEEVIEIILWQVLGWE